MRRFQRAERAVKTFKLAEVRIFQDLDAAQVNELLKLLHPVRLTDSEILFREGDPGAELFIVKTGSVSISVSLSDGKTLQIASFSPGEFLGEMSIFEKQPRSATCRAMGATQLLSLREDDLLRLTETNPAAAAKIMRRMLAVTRRRLEDTGELLSDLVQWGEEARKRAVSDPLTGLHNRRYLEEALPQYLRKARESGKPLALVMLDLDHFRRVNEEYSEQEGDRVLQAAAAIYRRHLRSTDVAARYGGDEFTFILPDTDLDTACRLMDAIRGEVEQSALAGTAVGVTTSQGVACFPRHAGSLPELREAADAALYRAKQLGRNRVVAAEDPEGR